MIIIIAFKGAVQDFFYNLLAAPRTVSNTYTQVVKAQSCENHVQHIERLSHNHVKITCNTSSAYHTIMWKSRATHQAPITQSCENHVQHIKRLSHNRVKITCNTSSAYHMQRVVCRLVRRDSSAVKFDRVEITFTLALLYWLKPLTDAFFFMLASSLGLAPWALSFLLHNIFYSQLSYLVVISQHCPHSKMNYEIEPLWSNPVNVMVSLSCSFIIQGS